MAQDSTIFSIVMQPMYELEVAPRGYPLSQQILRTDVSGMPLEWIDYREAARLYHT